MHIPDGILPTQVCIAGYALAGGITWVALRQIRKTPDPQAQVPKASLLAAAFFVGSSISIPIPPASVHLLLNGLLGTLLNWYAWPAVLIGLLLQAILLGHGGLTTLGVNAVMIGGSALISAQIFQLHHRFPALIHRKWFLGTFGFLPGAIGFGLAAVIFFGLILFTIPANLDRVTEQGALAALMIAHIPLVFVEGGFTAFIVLFLHRIKPELLEN